MATVDPKDTIAVIAAQRSWLCERQKAAPTDPILIKAIEGGMPKGADLALYKWVDHGKVWGKITTPIYTSGTLLNEILIDTDSEIWNDVRDGVRKLHLFCDENDIPHLMGFSGGKGIHFSIIFEQITAEDKEASKELFTQVEKYNVDAYKTIRRALLLEITKRANVDLKKIGLDNRKIDFGFAKKGSQVREFGTIRAPGKYKTLITEIPDEKPEPFELPLVFPEEVEIWDIKDTEYYEIAIDAIKNAIEKEKNADEYTPISDENFKDITITKFPCIDKLFKVGVRNGRYYAVVATVLMCYKCGISKDETKKHLTTLCKTFPGITQDETDIRINNALEMYSKEDHFSCTTIKETFPEHNLCNFSQCPIKEKIEEARQDLSYNKCLEEMRKLVPEGDEDNRYDQAKNFIKCSNLLKLNVDEALEIVLKTCGKFDLKKKWEDNITRFYNRLKKDEAANQNRISNAGQKDETGNEVENELIKSLATQNGKGLLACEKWVTEFKLIIAKMQPESLAKKLIDPRERKYTHSNFICSVKDKFLLLAYETEEIYREIFGINSTYHNEKRRLNNILIKIQNYPYHIREKADKLLLEGDPQEFIQATFKKKHIGDETLAETLPVCAASTFLIGKNSGLPFKISGSSGKGKSSGVDAFLDLIPSYMLIKGGLSDKYLYYSDDMQAGSICFVDDKVPSDSMKELMKNSITNFQKPEHHRTVINGEPKDLAAPERTVWILASVDGFDDDQMDNRFLKAGIDTSREQDSKVAAFQRESENVDISSSFKDDIETCKCIFDLIGLRTYDVRIPFAEAIIWNHEHNRRNQPKFFDIIRAVCLYKIHQREQLNGYFLATIEDYERAYEIYEKTTVQNNVNLTESEQKIINCFVQANQAKEFYKNQKPGNAARLTYEQLEALTGINKPYLKKLIVGKDAQSLGLGGKVKGLGSEGSGDGKQKKLLYYTGAANFEIYQKFSSLSSEDEIVKAIYKSREDLEQAVNEENEIIKAAFQGLSDSLPSLPAVTLPLPSQKVTGIKDKNNISIINNIVRKGIVTLKKENDPEYNFSTHTNSKNIENKEVENIEHIVCKNSSNTLISQNSSNTLISQNQGNAPKTESPDNEIPVTFPKVTAGDEGNGGPTDTETSRVTGAGDTKSLEIILNKIKEYLNKECHGNSITKPLDTHINDFRKLYPEFKKESRLHLGYAFNKVLKTVPPLGKSQQKEDTLQKPAAEKKGIAILKKALQAEKVVATL